MKKLKCSDAVTPKLIDHICLIVRDIYRTEEYLKVLFDLETRLKEGAEDVMICENKHLHFFVKQKDWPKEFLQEQHLSLTVNDIEAIANKLDNQGIKYEIGVFNGFWYNNYRWIEWRDENGIRFECVEEK